MPPYRVIDRLVNETGDNSIRVGFGMANALHQNLYENWGNSNYVAGGLGDVGELLDKLERLLDYDTTG